MGLQVQTNVIGMHLSQVKYADDLLKRANMLECKPSSTPLAAKVVLSAHDGALLSFPIEYRMLVGCLQYLTLTCPDISFAVNNVAHSWEALARLTCWLSNVYYATLKALLINAYFSVHNPLLFASPSIQTHIRLGALTHAASPQATSFIMALI